MPDAEIQAIARSCYEARDRIREFVPPTNVRRSHLLSSRFLRDVFYKMETENITGSFKIRGATNKLLLLKEAGVDSVVTASTGNHALAISRAAQLIGIRPQIFVPENVSKAKLAKLKSFDIDLHLHGTDGIDAERAAREQAVKDELPYVSPYNDFEVLAGQGSIAVEILEQLDSVESVYLSLGGGGLAGGVGSVLKCSGLEIQHVAASPQHSAIMAESIEAGEIINRVSLPTISDGTAGGLEQDSVTFPICQSVIDRHVIVEESGIREACSFLNFEEGIRSEGAAALALAAFLIDKNKSDGPVVIVLCGSNISNDLLDELKVDG